MTFLPHLPSLPPHLPPLHTDSLTLPAATIAGIALALVWYLQRYLGRMRPPGTSASVVHPSTRRLLPFGGANGRSGWTPAGGTGTQAGPGEDTILSVTPTRTFPFWRQRAPRPLRWVVESLIPWGPEHPWWHWGPPARAYVTGILGTGGVGKSSILIDLALALLTGQDWLGCSVKKVRRVLYVDTELDRDMCARRAAPLARGRGLDGVPKGLKYFHPSGSLAARYTKTADGEEGYMSDGMASIGDAVRKTKADILLVDSLTIGSPGASLSDQNAWNRIINGLESLGLPVVLIDHMNKSGTGGAVGSFIKQAKTRSVLELSPSGGRIKVEHTKSNFGPLQPTMLVECQRMGPDPLDPTCVYYATKGMPELVSLYPFGAPDDVETERPAPIPLRALPAPQPGGDAATRAILAYCQAHREDSPWMQARLAVILEQERVVPLRRAAIQGRLKQMVDEGLLVRADRFWLSLPVPETEEEVTSA